MYTVNTVFMLDKKIIINLLTKARLLICKCELKRNAEPTLNYITI